MTHATCTRRAALAVATVLLLAPAAARAQSPDSTGVRGTVVNAATGEPLARATVSVSGAQRSAITDAAGRYRLTEIAPGSYVIVRARLLGYHPQETRVLVRAGQVAEASFRLTAAPLTLTPVLTTGQLTERERFEQVPEVGTFTLAGSAVRAVPAAAEADVLRTVQLLPGVVARNDYSAGYNVHGGESDQNLVLLDGVPLFNPFHLGGLFGTFIEPTVGDVRLQAGGFPAPYGGRLSSVLEVTSAEEARSGVHGAANVSLLATSLVLGGARPASRTSWNVAARRTYADRIAGAVSDRTLPYHFRDEQAHVTQGLPGGGVLSATVYDGRDVLRTDYTLFSQEDTAGVRGSYDYDWGNTAGGLTFSQPLGESTSLLQRASYSRFSSTLDLGGGARVRRNAIAEQRLGGSLTSQRGAHLLTVGYDVARTAVEYRETSPQATAQLQSLDQTQGSGSVFAEDVWRVGERLLLRPGVRVERVGGGASWTGVSPRLSARWFVSPDLAVTAAGGRYAQWVRSLSNEDVPLRFFDSWVASDATIPVTTSTQAAAGVERWLSPTRMLRVEGFYKDYQDLVEPDPEDDRARQGDEFRAVDGSSYGVDVFARQIERGAFSGWASYSYTVNRRAYQGEGFFPAHDRRHNLNVVGSYQTASRYAFGARLGVGSGLPYTGIDAQLVRRLYDGAGGQFETGVVERDIQQLGGRRNAERYPSYQRVDVSVSRRFIRRDATVTPYLSVLNVLNRRNVFAYDFDYEGSPPTREAVSQFPVLPSVGLTVEF